ncbi:MAG: RnfABCDGE type electron transport complex subunit B, partial [Betaproteobacteria bacterium]|nr:RnfABCDGE type electron transport complex subunit B [Betaproteobacteria bacterium]
MAGAIDAALPQTQCGKCGYAGCRPYADAIVDGRADINQCPPGGADAIRAIARLLAVPEKPLDPAFGVEAPPALAVIDEKICIGCTLCIQACPVDAIVGAAKLMHTVIASECTGCELCLAPCPVDCIAMVETGRVPTREDSRRSAAHARMRFEARNRRLAAQRAARTARLAAKRAASNEDVKRATIARAV